MAWKAIDRKPAAYSAEADPLLSEAVREKIRSFFPKYETKRAVLLPALHIVQNTLGHVSIQAMAEIAEVLEIDARLPSQTPTAVFQSMGVNMVGLLGELFLTGEMNITDTDQPQTVIYEHIKVTDDRIEVAGEHIVSGAGPLELHQGLFGANEVITNYHPDLSEWVATLIFKGENAEEVLDKKRRTYENIRSIGTTN